MSAPARRGLIGRTACTFALALATLLGGCAMETTGDPRQGGLFGWSEEKAKARQEEKQANVAGANVELSRQNAAGEALENRQGTAEHNLRAADALKRRQQAQLDDLENRLVEKTKKLEAGSPTAATASRARAYRLNVATIAANSNWSLQERGEELIKLERKIDAALFGIR